MRRWADESGGNLRWVGIAARRHLLRSPGGTLARLAWRSTSGTLADGGTAAGSWTVKRMGFFRPFVTARRAGEDTEVAVFVRDGSAGDQLTVAGGRSDA